MLFVIELFISISENTRACFVFSWTRKNSEKTTQGTKGHANRVYFWIAMFFVENHPLCASSMYEANHFLLLLFSLLCGLLFFVAVFVIPFKAYPSPLATHPFFRRPFYFLSFNYDQFSIRHFFSSLSHMSSSFSYSYAISFCFLYSVYGLVSHINSNGIRYWSVQVNTKKSIKLLSTWKLTFIDRFILFQRTTISLDDSTQP